MANKNKDFPNKMSLKALSEQTANPTGVETYTPGDEEAKIVHTIFTRFRDSANNRDTSYRYLGNRNIVEYIEDSVYRFISNMDEREGIEDWQARVNVPMTHNKVNTVLGKIVSMLPIAEIIPRNGSNPKKVKYLSELYEYAEDIDDYEELMICAVLEAIVKGTVVGFEGYEYKEKKIREITGYDSEDRPTFNVKTIKESKLPGAIVPLEEFYPASVAIRRMEDMPYAFWRRVIPFSKFIEVYSCFPRYTHVNAKFTNPETEPGSKTQYNSDLISNDVNDGNVEVIMYFNKDTDEYVLMANGVWLNPLSDWSVAPLPYNHKRLPFWSARFDTIGADFFYGRSLVDRLQGLQDVLNVLTNMALDQSFLTIFPPVLTAGIDPIEDDYLRPGRRVPVDTQGLPLNQAFMKLDLGTPSGWHQWMLNYVSNVMEMASVDQVASGQAGVGGRTTAEEIRAAASSVSAILGVFGKLLNMGIKNKALLKASNIAQFWSDPQSPISSRVLGVDDESAFAKAFNVITMNNAKLANGKHGTKMIGMYANKQDLPSTAVMKTEALMNELESGVPTEMHAITGDTIRDLELDVKFVPNTKSNDTKEIQKALALEKVRVYKSFFPNTVNDVELQNNIAEVFGDDPAKMFKEATPPPQEQPAPGQTRQEVPTQPMGDVANNMVRGMMGGEAGAMSMRDVAQQ